MTPRRSVLLLRSRLNRLASLHFTTIAHLVSMLSAGIARVFAAVVAICDSQGLIGREMFAVDGVKLPSNAAKHLSGATELD